MIENLRVWEIRKELYKRSDFVENLINDRECDSKCDRRAGAEYDGESGNQIELYDRAEYDRETGELAPADSDLRWNQTPPCSPPAIK